MKQIVTHLSLTLLSAHLIGFVFPAHGEVTERIQAPRAIVDSDGDGTPDAVDPNPLIAEVPWISWRVSPMTVGWKLNTSIDEIKNTLNEQEKEILSRREYTFGKRVELSADIKAGASATFSLNPVKMLSSGAEAAFQSRFGAASDVSWRDSDQNFVKDFSKLITQTQIASHLSEMQLEFTVTFYNFSEEDFVGENVQIPIKVGESVATIAQYMGPNGPESLIRIPAHRDRGTPVRFRANLDTTQSLALLKAMERESPTVALEESQGAIISKRNDRVVDAISELTYLRRKTCAITVAVNDVCFTYCVARRNEATGKFLQLSEALSAINSLHSAGENKNKVFEFTDGYLRSGFGNDCQLDPVGWWVHSSNRGTAPDTDVDLSSKLPDSLNLRYRLAFPNDMRRWLKLAERSDVWAILVVAELWKTGRGGFGLDPQEAVKSWSRASELGSAQAATYIGLAYENGYGGLPKDEAKAVSFWQRAGDLGDARALVNLGAAYDRGIGGLAKDEVKAVQLWQEAANRGDARALLLLGVAYDSGKGGLTKNAMVAVEMWKKSAALENSSALVNLGLAHLKGHGQVSKDEKMTLAYWKKASDLNDAKARFNLSLAQGLGIGGIRKDEKETEALLLSALNSPDPEIKKHYDNILKSQELALKLVTFETVLDLFSNKRPKRTEPKFDPTDLFIQAGDSGDPWVR